MSDKSVSTSVYSTFNDVIHHSIVTTYRVPIPKQFRHINRSSLRSGGNELDSLHRLSNRMSACLYFNSSYICQVDFEFGSHNSLVPRREIPVFFFSWHILLLFILYISFTYLLSLHVLSLDVVPVCTYQFNPDTHYSNSISIIKCEMKLLIHCQYLRWISNFIPQFMIVVIIYPCWVGFASTQLLQEFRFELGT